LFDFPDISVVLVPPTRVKSSFVGIPRPIALQSTDNPLAVTVTCP
jgi:hypothetical protein